MRLGGEDAANTVNVTGFGGFEELLFCVYAGAWWVFCGGEREREGVSVMLGRLRKAGKKEGGKEGDEKERKEGVSEVRKVCE